MVGFKAAGDDRRRMDNEAICSRLLRQKDRREKVHVRY
jgi:hypothetical protein